MWVDLGDHSLSVYSFVEVTVSHDKPHYLKCIQLGCLTYVYVHETITVVTCETLTP